MPAQGARVPDILVGVAGSELPLGVTVSEDTPPEPQLLLAETCMTPGFAPIKTAIDVVVDDPLKPDGSIQE